MILDLILLAPALEFGKEVYYLTSLRWERQVAPAPDIPLTYAEQLEDSYTMLQQMSVLGTMAFLLACPYYVLCETSALQGTLGKRLLGLRVTDLDHRRIRPDRAFLRYVTRLVSAMPWMFGYIMAGFTRKRQALHDILAKTLVLKGGEETPRSDSLSPKPACSHCASALLPNSAFCNRCGHGVSAGRANYVSVGFGRRAIAALVDIAVVTPVVLYSLVRFPIVTPEQIRTFLQFYGKPMTRVQYDDLFAISFVNFLYAWAILILVSAPYCILTENSRMQGTLGKRALGLRVTDRDGRRLGLGRALERYLTRFLSGALWMVGFFMPAFTAGKETLHDILSGTRVVLAGLRVGHQTNGGHNHSGERSS